MIMDFYSFLFYFFLESYPSCTLIVMKIRVMQDSLGSSL
uniref:Uncharacterized protein n=1 Tax=Rhizophora mucronata TaxID=61149 RepID=A0A2P2Q3K4_RHIMU